MVSILNVYTNAVMSDTSILLLNFLKTGYQALTTPTPAYANIIFDTKWYRIDKDNLVFIESIKNMVDKVNLGGMRYRYSDYKRLQLVCKRGSAINNRYNLERNLEIIINTNPTGLQVNGVTQLFIEEFNPLTIKPAEDEINEGQASEKAVNLSRSAAIVKMVYECYVG